MQIPHGIEGWTIFITGLLIVGFRIHGIDAPRAWVEWVERQFTYATNLRYIGAVLVIAGAALVYFGGFSSGLLGSLFLICAALLIVIGLSMMLLQNHLRHIVFASAEGSDKMLRIMSIVIVLFGLGLALAPFFLK